MDEGSIRLAMAGLFVSTWRIARQQLWQQQGTLRYLYDAAQSANAEIPQLPMFDLSQLTQEQAQALSDFFDDDRAARGARDAYATAVVMYVDDMLKMQTSFYRRIPGAESNLTVRVEGLDIPTIFKHAGNNIRHYQDWRTPAGDLTRPDLALATVATLATLMRRPIPTRETVSLWGANWAWPVLHKVSNGTFDGLISVLVLCMDEMLNNSGMSEHELVVADRERHPL